MLGMKMRSPWDTLPVVAFMACRSVRIPFLAATLHLLVVPHALHESSADCEPSFLAPTVRAQQPALASAPLARAVRLLRALRAPVASRNPNSPASLQRCDARQHTRPPE